MGAHDLEFVAGATKELQAQWLIGGAVQPLTDWAVRSHVRSAYAPEGVRILDLGAYASKTAEHWIVIRVPAQVTAALEPALFRRARWDLFVQRVSDPATAVPLLEGDARLKRSATVVGAS